MILTVLVMLVLALVLLAYVLEPVLRADDEHVEIDAAVETPPIPDFVALLEGDEEQPADATEQAHSPVQHPEPAEHRS